MNSFGNRNFMQPMGRLSMHSKCLDFIFLLRFLLGRGRGWDNRFFFILSWFSMCSHYVLFKFPMGSQYIAQVPIVFPNMFFIAPHFYLICFSICCPPFTYIGGPKGRNSMLQKITFYFYFYFGVMSQSNWLIAKF